MNARHAEKYLKSVVGILGINTQTLTSILFFPLQIAYLIHYLLSFQWIFLYCLLS